MSWPDAPQPSAHRQDWNVSEFSFWRFDRMTLRPASPSMSRDAIAATINYTFYAHANIASRPFVAPDILSNLAVYPNAEVMARLYAQPTPTDEQLHLIRGARSEIYMTFSSASHIGGGGAATARTEEHRWMEPFNQFAVDGHLTPCDRLSDSHCFLLSYALANRALPRNFQAYVTNIQF
jgi:hypothetical protein